MRILLDTNILLRLEDLNHVQHDAEIVPVYARRVVKNVLDGLVVKSTLPESNGQEMADLSLLGSDSPLALNEAINNTNPLIAVLAAWMLLRLAETQGPYEWKRSVGRRFDGSNECNLLWLCHRGRMKTFNLCHPAER